MSALLMAFSPPIQAIISSWYVKQADMRPSSPFAYCRGLDNWEQSRHNALEKQKVPLFLSCRVGGSRADVPIKTPVPLRIKLITRLKCSQQAVAIPFGSFCFLGGGGGLHLPSPHNFLSACSDKHRLPVMRFLPEDKPS